MLMYPLKITYTSVKTKIAVHFSWIYQQTKRNSPS